MTRFPLQNYIFPLEKLKRPCHMSQWVELNSTHTFDQPIKHNNVWRPSDKESSVIWDVYNHLRCFVGLHDIIKAYPNTNFHRFTLAVHRFCKKLVYNRLTPSTHICGFEVLWRSSFQINATASTAPFNFDCLFFLAGLRGKTRQPSQNVGCGVVVASVHAP